MIKTKEVLTTMLSDKFKIIGNYKLLLIFIIFSHIITPTEPDTPLNDAYHVGSINL